MLCATWYCKKACVTLLLGLHGVGAFCLPCRKILSQLPQPHTSCLCPIANMISHQILLLILILMLQAPTWRSVPSCGPPPQPCALTQLGSNPVQPRPPLAAHRPLCQDPPTRSPLLIPHTQPPPPLPLHSCYSLALRRHRRGPQPASLPLTHRRGPKVVPHLTRLSTPPCRPVLQPLPLPQSKLGKTSQHPRQQRQAPCR